MALAHQFGWPVTSQKLPFDVDFMLMQMWWLPASS